MLMSSGSSSVKSAEMTRAFDAQYLLAERDSPPQSKAGVLTCSPAIL